MASLFFVIFITKWQPKCCFRVNLANNDYQMKPLFVFIFLSLGNFCFSQQIQTIEQQPVDTSKVKTQKISKASKIEKRVYITRQPARKETPAKRN